MSKKVGVSREEMALPYYKYFTQPLAQVPAEKLAVLAGGASKISAVPFDRHNLFLRAEDGDYCRLGYGVAEDGTAFVCNETYMPGVTGEMLDWWFPWHRVGSDLRYKIWDPRTTISPGPTGAITSVTPQCPCTRRPGALTTTSWRTWAPALIS